jgi:hypothetical protein
MMYMRWVFLFTHLHRAVAPDFGIVAIVANDHGNFHPLRPVGDERTEIAGRPPFVDPKANTEKKG